MVSFTALLATTTAAVFAALASAETGYHNGFFYSFWTDGLTPVQYQNAAYGSYGVNWQQAYPGGNFVGGKGWAQGGRRTISYTGGYYPQGNSYLAVYGWTRYPLVEYYIVESYGTYNPSTGAQKRGSVYADGGWYDIYQTTRYNAPSIDGTQTFQQFWSVRQQKRVGGTVTTGTHFDAWASVGLKLGSSFDYMIVATEGYQSAGSAWVSINSGARIANATDTNATEAASTTETAV